MAYRAGARVANMEFFQFHPTCLYHPQAKTFLISEALRGEGGVLRLRDGTAFMQRYHEHEGPRAARRRGARHRRRDEAHRRRLRRPRHDATCDGDFVRERFPNIHERCLRASASTSRTQPIPVVPAAHYMLRRRGRSTRAGAPTMREPVRDRRGRDAPGCTARTGWRRTRCSRAWCSPSRARRRRRAHAELAPRSPRTIAPWDAGEARRRDEAVVVTHNWDEIRRLMWNYVGIVRTDSASSAPRAASSCSARRSASTTGTSRSRATCSSCATSRSSPS